MALLYLDSWIAELEGAGVKPADLSKSKKNASIEGILDSMSEAVPEAKQNTKKATKKNVSAAAEQPTELHIGLLEFRVGKIVECWPHPGWVALLFFRRHLTHASYLIHGQNPRSCGARRLTLASPSCASLQAGCAPSTLRKK
mmetsp:Transcript_86998/g.168491  ORF Transcript_86998/g.168491 Transcript_86998/m.168491 type:complete len:142 (-) Transcript_86998:587-1012(-)